MAPFPAHSLRKTRIFFMFCFICFPPSPFSVSFFRTILFQDRHISRHVCRISWFARRTKRTPIPLVFAFVCFPLLPCCSFLLTSFFFVFRMFLFLFRFLFFRFFFLLFYQAALADRLVRPIPPSAIAPVDESDNMVDVDSFEVEEASQGGGEGGNLEGGGGEGKNWRHQDFLKVEGEVLERGLRDLVPSLCAYLRGHTEVSQPCPQL